MATKTSGAFQRVIGRVLWLTPLLAAMGCGAGFDSPDWVKSLRVLGVQKDQPYAPPTRDPANPTQVNLTMLDYDGTRTDPPRKIQRLWFSGCDDLPGDQYFTCLVRMYYLWKAYSNPPDNLAPRPEWKDGMSWSPLDDIPTDLSPDVRLALIQESVSKVYPNFPLELVESYLKTYRIGSGPRFVYPIPPLIIENHHSISDPSIPQYGLSFIFFTVCAGHIELAPNWQNVDLGATLQNATLGFPFVCLDNDSGNALGPDDFISGYTELFVPSDGTVNHNPAIDGVSFNGKNLDAVADGVAVGADAGAGAGAKAFCIDGDCVPLPTPDRCADVPPSRHVPHCSGKCPAYEFSPTLDTTIEDNKDSGLFASQRGSPIGEQMWVDYYTDRGTLNHAVKLLRDANSGWSDDHSDTWTPPSDPGPVNLWAVAHDTRGGTGWVQLQICVD